MRDAAAAAAMSDPERNPAFRRRWLDAGAPVIVCAVAADGEPYDLVVTGRELLEQWRRERVAAAESGRTCVVLAPTLIA